MDLFNPVIWQLGPTELDRMASGDYRTILVYGAYAVFATLSGAIVVLYKSYRDEVKENREAADHRLGLFAAEVQENKRQNQETVRVLLEFSATMAQHVDALKAIVPLIERHERETKDSRAAHEQRIQAIMQVIADGISRRP